MERRLITIRRTQITITIVAVTIAVAHLIWPTIAFDSATLFLIAIAVIPWVIKLFKSMEFPGGWKFELREEEEMATEAIAKAKVNEEIKFETVSNSQAIKWDKVATIFWLGNDLMWIQDMMYRVAPPERVLQGVEHAIYYIEELGFAKDSPPIQQLSLAQLTLRQLVGISPTDENRMFLEVHYRGIQQYVQTVKWYFDALATNKQPDFKKLRAL